MFKERSRLRVAAAAIAVLVAASACGGGGDDTGTGDAGSELDGRWNGGEDWGEVIIKGSTGTYSDTFGPDPGIITLRSISPIAYTGVWTEGPDRFGTLVLEVESDDVITGTWTADPDSAIVASSGGLLRWQRD